LFKIDEITLKLKKENSYHGKQNNAQKHSLQSVQHEKSPEDQSPVYFMLSAYLPWFAGCFVTALIKKFRYNL
jgi:hypothetical protein